MRVKFNKFEKVAGVFVLVAFGGFFVSSLAIAVKKGWFSSKVMFVTSMQNADGLHPGTVVQMSGLRAGAVDDIELISANEVKVRFYVLDKFAAQVKQDSAVSVLRQFIIGDKILEVSVGSADQPKLAENSSIPTAQSFDIMDFVGGRKMNGLMASFDHMAESLKIFAEAFGDPERSRALVSMVDNLVPMIKNVNTMSVNITKVTDTALKQKRLETMISNLTAMTEQINRILPEFTKDVPDMGQQMAQIVQNLNVLTSEFRKLTPAINEIAPDLPRTSKRAVEALDETVVLLKAMQRSWLLRGNVKDVKAEEEKTREPAEAK